MAIQIQLRRDLSSNWASNNPILAQGEPGLEIDTNLIKLGDGTTNWNSLPYFSNLTGLVSLTANWEDTYSIMQANSANWSYVAANSAHTDNSFGNSAYTTVNTNSAGWESTETTVATNSADWSYVVANSGYSYNDFYVTGDIYATGSLSADSIKFNTEAGIIPGVGELTWNADEESLDYGVNSDVTLQIGQEQLIHVKAEEDIKNGQAVYASGASGAGSGNITVRLYRAAAGDIDELYFIGVATQDISTNNFGFVTTFGKVRDVQVADTRASDDPQALSANNEGWDIGTVLYVSPAEAGKFTQTKPTAPDRDIPVVMIISENGNQRTFFTRYEHGYHLDEIHDVLYNEPLEDGDLLTWNDTLSTWQNLPETDPVFSTWAQANSANYESTFTTVNANSSSWAAGGSGSGSLSGISYNRWAFTGSPPVSSFSLSGATSDIEESFRVTVDSFLQDPVSYTISGETIVFSEAPPLSSSIVVVESYATAGTGSGTGGTKTYAVFTPLDAQPPASNFATLDTRNSIAVLDFDATTEESTTFVGILPEGADVSSGLKVRLHWAASSATTGSCRWGVQFEKSGTDLDSDSFDTATGNHSTTDGTSGIETITEITATTIDSITAGDRFRIKVYRDATDAINDTMTGDAELIAVEIRSAV